MKRQLLLHFFILLGLQSFAQNYNLDSVSHVNYQALHSANLNDCWGYTDETGIEYALVGTTKGTSIVSLADPQNPIEIFWEPGTESIWRDLQVYNDVMYVTTEAEDGLLIVDLSPLPQSTVLPVTYYFGTTGAEWQSAHDILFILIHSILWRSVSLITGIATTHTPRETGYMALISVTDSFQSLTLRITQIPFF
jgi:choice-of-anchor B domain-containing protein